VHRCAEILHRQLAVHGVCTAVGCAGVKAFRSIWATGDPALPIAAVHSQPALPIGRAKYRARPIGSAEILHHRSMCTAVQSDKCTNVIKRADMCVKNYAESTGKRDSIVAKVYGHRLGHFRRAGPLSRTTFR
jgi:hypothetical protein